MNLEPAPRLKKVPFIAAAVACLAAVVLISLFAPNKFAPLPFLSAVGFLILSITVFMIPLLTDYAADSAEYVQQERVRVEEQVQRLHAAGESLARAAAQIKAVEEAVHKTAHAAETLPYRMQEKLAEFNAALAEAEESDRTALEDELVELRATNSAQLKALADKIHQATTDWTALETATRKQLAAAEGAVSKVRHTAGDIAEKFEARLTAALETLDTKLNRLAPPAATPALSATPFPPDDAPVPPARAADAAEPVSAPVLVESVSVIEPDRAAEIISETEEPKIKKLRVPRKPKPEDMLSTMSEPAPVHGEPDAAFGDFSLDDAPDERASVSAPEAPEAAASSDGATRLLVTAYIGIGNKLFIRGEGPGLKRDKGVPMHFVSIGKWGWATNDATAPVHCELYKNDETVALTGEVVLDPGRHVEITALF